MQRPNSQEATKAAIAEKLSRLNAELSALQDIQKVLPSNLSYTKRIATALNKEGWTGTLVKLRDISHTLYVWGKGIPYDERVSVYLSHNYGEMYRCKTPNDVVQRNREHVEALIANARERIDLLANLDVALEYQKLMDAATMFERAQAIIDDTPYTVRDVFGITN